jgi:hypothetical protein
MLRPDRPLAPAISSACCSRVRAPAHWTCFMSDRKTSDETLARLAVDLQIAPGLEIGLGRLLAFAQIGVDLVPLGGRHAIGHAPHRAAGRQAQHQARPLIGAAMVDRIDAEGPPTAMEHGRSSLYEREPGPPHERSVSEHPRSVAAPLRSSPIPTGRAHFMTHNDVAPSRKARRRGLLAPFIIAWPLPPPGAIGWFWLRGQAEQRMDAASAALKARGYDLSWSARTFSRLSVPAGRQPDRRPGGRTVGLGAAHSRLRSEADDLWPDHWVATRPARRGADPPERRRRRHRRRGPARQPGSA